jgi:glycosyltransferase involved in cell wall biosynthesis
MDLIDFSKNEDSISKQEHIESVLLYGNPDAVSDAEITICIPTYKRANLLKESIASAVNQFTNIPYRIIVVDNDPDFDNTEVLDIIRDFNRDNLSYYKNKENLLMLGNWNRCVVLARTRWAALLHDDDLLLGNYLNVVSNILFRHRKKIDGLSIGCIVQDYPYGYSDMKKKCLLRSVLKILYSFIKFLCLIKKFVTIPCSANLFLGNVYGAPTCGMIFKRNSFIKTGGFNPSYFPSADWFFLIFYSENYKFYKYREKLAIYRWGVNTSLREDVLEGYKYDRNKCIFSLKKRSKLCSFFMMIFKKDFNVVVNSRLDRSVKTSVLYRIVCYAYGLLYN